MNIIDLTAHRQAREAAEFEALNMDQTTIELLTLNGDLEDEAELVELARQALYPPLYSVKRG